MKNTKVNHCPFCSTWTTLYQLIANDGSEWWACKEAIDPSLATFTCYSMWERQLRMPIEFTIKDF